MIRMEEITIKEFRGIRDLTLQFSSQNFAICGPNGTGKSGIVDAIEFVLTGNISRLSGEGTKDLSVKEHGPHVDFRNNPDKAEVSLQVYIPSINKTATISRTVKNAKNIFISPNDQDVLSALQQVGLHPEFVLSRREIIRYVLAEPGKRSKEVQALLRLKDLEDMRTVLLKIKNATNRDLKPLQNAKNNAIEDLKRAMGITKATPTEILKAANEKRTLLLLPEISTLEADTSLKDGLTAIGSSSPMKVQKSVAVKDIEATKSKLQTLNNNTFQSECNSINEAILALENEAPDGTSKEDLLQTALRLFDEEHCPVCDTDWKPLEFRQTVGDKLKALEEISKKKIALQLRIEEVCTTVEDFTSSLRLVYSYAQKLTPPTKTENITEYGKSIVAAINQLRKFTPVADTLTALNTLQTIPEIVVSEIDEIDSEIQKIPEASQQDAARDYLVVAQERLDSLRQASLRSKEGGDEEKIAREVFETYVSATTDALEEIYREVEKSFTELYKSINDDEEGFDAQLIPSAGKLGFDVDFYGRGFFPPGAYHSEGHQDGMGLCLYLALMQHLLGDEFTFAVLDDVLMSVDASHRRQVSKMLAEKFPNTQFIMTTHDDVWLNHMKSSGLVPPRCYAHFRKWTVEMGPTEWDERDVWEEIADSLTKNDVRAAAALLRHYLEHISQELCHILGAQVRFRDDRQFVLGDLLPSAVSKFKKHLKAGKASAQSWSNQEELDRIQHLDEKLAEAIKASQVEQWQINTAVHYNEWARLDKKDFEPVAAAYKSLIDCFKCHDCHGFLYVVPDRGSSETLRCGCSKASINLIEKPKKAAA